MVDFGWVNVSRVSSVISGSVIFSKHERIVVVNAVVRSVPQLDTSLIVMKHRRVVVHPLFNKLSGIATRP